jgi:hypothetical protein
MSLICLAITLDGFLVQTPRIDDPYTRSSEFDDADLSPFLELSVHRFPPCPHKHAEFFLRNIDLLPKILRKFQQTAREPGLEGQEGRFFQSLAREPEALAKKFDDLCRDRRLALEQILELVPPDHEEFDLARSDCIGAPWMPVQQRDLAEDVAWSENVERELPSGIRCRRNHDLPTPNAIESITRISPKKQCFSVEHLPGRAQGCNLGDRIGTERREK